MSNKRHVTRTAVFTIAAAVFLFSTYKVFVYYLDRLESRQTYSEVKQLYYAETVTLEVNPIPVMKTKSTEQAQPVVHSTAETLKIQDKFADLVKRNEDIVGWLRIEDTVIDFPVMQADDNVFYLERDINKNPNAAGAIFMDYRNNASGSDRHTILYGHNMKDGAMFAELLRYESRWNFENRSIVQFDGLYGDAKWEIFSVYTTEAKVDYLQTDFPTDDAYLSFLETIQAKSLHPKDATLTIDDRILTLSTCSYAYHDARFVVHARLVADRAT